MILLIFVNKIDYSIKYQNFKVNLTLFYFGEKHLYISNLKFCQLKNYIAFGVFF